LELLNKILGLASHQFPFGRFQGFQQPSWGHLGKENKDMKIEKRRKKHTDGLLHRDRVGRGRCTVNWGMREAVDLSIDGLEGLQVQSDFAIHTLEAPFVKVFISSLDILKGINGLLADIALRVGHR
jgi:hypothetical protein